MYLYKKLRGKKNLLRKLTDKNFCTNLYYNNLYFIIPKYSFGLTEMDIKFNSLKILFNSLLEYNTFDNIIKDLNCKQREFLIEKINFIKCEEIKKVQIENKNNIKYKKNKNINLSTNLVNYIIKFIYITKVKSKITI